MRKKTVQFIISLIACFFCSGFFLFAQISGDRMPYPWGLKNSYYGLSTGAINYPFSGAQLEPGFSVKKIVIPHIAPRFILYGYQFNKNISVQLSYLRPVNWVIYNNINNDGNPHSVWMNIGGVTFASHLPVTKKITLFAETGLGFITRKGFKIDNKTALKNAAFATLLSGVSVQYHFNNKWEAEISTTRLLPDKKVNQPHMVYYAAGFKYHLKEVSPENDRKNNPFNIFHKHIIQISYTTNQFGYGSNQLLSKKIPIFWGGAAQLKKGFSVSYQRNIYHTPRLFSINWGAGFSWWKTNKENTAFFTLSVFPVLRFTAVRSGFVDVYFEYSVAGPTYISRLMLDAEETGRHFTFQDMMGIGFLVGEKRKINTSVKITHYSNGNLFIQNCGVMVPLTFSIGYNFD